MTKEMSRPAFRQFTRCLSYKPRVHSLTTPKAQSQIERTPDKVSEMQTLLRSFTTDVGIASSLPDGLARQVFTHKSFDHGRQAYNEKLSFLGRRVLYLRLTEHLLDRPTSSPGALEGRDLSAINTTRLESLLSLESIARVAPEGLSSLVRWQPKDSRDRAGSGERKVVAETVMALVGAIEIQFGAGAAKSFVDRRILPKLALHE